VPKAIDAVLFGWEYASKVKMYHASDDHSAIEALDKLWRQTKGTLRPSHKIVRIGVWFGGLVKGPDRQSDLFHTDADEKWESLTESIDALNWRYGKTAVSIGPCCALARISVKG